MLEGAEKDFYVKAYSRGRSVCCTVAVSQILLGGEASTLSPAPLECSVGGEGNVRLMIGSPKGDLFRDLPSDSF